MADKPVFPSLLNIGEEKKKKEEAPTGFGIFAAPAGVGGGTRRPAAGWRC